MPCTLWAQTSLDYMSSMIQHSDQISQVMWILSCFSNQSGP